MGTQVTAALRSDTKPNYTVAYATDEEVAVADGELGVWVGANVSSQVEAYDAVLQCCQALREAGWPNPVTLENSAAVMDTVSGVITVSNGAAPTLAAGETEVAILQGLDFTNGGASNSAHIRRMLEVWLEQIAKLPIPT